MRIFLDDIRNPPLFDSAGDKLHWDKIIRNPIEAMELIKNGVVTFISFDHDLGVELTGYDVAKLVEKLAFEKCIPPIDYAIHSANPVGAGNIDKAMKSAWNIWSNGDL